MKAILFAACISVALCACATSGPQTSWGKAGVSKVDYGTDIGMCTGFAAQQVTGTALNTAGGVNGRNSQAPTGGDRGAQTAGAGQAAGNTGGTSSNMPSTGTYSGVASSDYAQRAATQQRTQEMLAKRARADAFNGCLAERGYREFTLTAEQRAHLATLKPGSSEYHSYLHTIGSDPATVGTAAK